MEFNDYTFEKIDKYVRGQLPKEEAMAFEKEIAASPDLQEAVDMARMEMDGMEYLLEEDLRAQVAEWENSPLPTDEPPKGGSGITPRWWLGLLAVAVVVGLFYFLKPTEPKTPPQPPTEETPKIDPSIPVAEEETPPKEENTEQVVENKSPENQKPQQPTPPADDYSGLIAYVETKAYQLPPDLDNHLKSGSTNQPDNALARGITAFLSTKYKTSIQELESIEKTSGLYERASEILPHAYFKNGQYGKAAKLFKQMADASAINKDEPEWYLLLSLMADYGKNKNAADALLRKIVEEEGHNYHGAALALKERMDALGK